MSPQKIETARIAAVQWVGSHEKSLLVAGCIFVVIGLFVEKHWHTASPVRIDQETSSTRTDGNSEAYRAAHSGYSEQEVRDFYRAAKKYNLLGN